MSGSVPRFSRVPRARRRTVPEWTIAVVFAIVSMLTTDASVGAQSEVWVEPVDAPVVDGWRPPAHIGAAGNRGWEYDTEPGAPVRAANDGVVVFAGSIGSALYVSVLHADGRRTTYSLLADLTVGEGDVVAAGDLLGSASDRFHFGVRIGADYLDPATLFVAVVGSAGPPDRGLRLVAPIGTAPRPVQMTQRFAATWLPWRFFNQLSIEIAAP